MNFRGLEFSFSWIFAIIVGAFILTLAIYGATKVVKTGSYGQNTENAQDITGLLRRTGTNVESSKNSLLSLPDTTEVNFGCSAAGDLGEQRISVKEINQFRNTPAGVLSTAKDIYIFSPQKIEGKDIHVLSFPFSFPYKVADILVLYTDNYCFVNAPDEVSDEINRLGVNDTISLAESKNKCPSNSISVCFAGAGCDVEVDLFNNKIIKDGKEENYDGNLLYGAIFSDSALYECTFTRLMERASLLAHLYTRKSVLLSIQGCSTSLAPDLSAYAGDLADARGSASLPSLSRTSSNIEEANNVALCKLF